MSARISNTFPQVHSVGHVFYEKKKKVVGKICLLHVISPLEIQKAQNESAEKSCNKHFELQVSIS